MKAIILAGGYATRLRPISYVLPKLLFPVLGKPMIYWTLEMLNQFGVDEVVLGVNYLANSLQAAIGNRYKGMRILYSLEKTPLGTAGPIKLASKAVKLKETFIAMNGDIISGIDLNAMLNHHRQANAVITDALHEVNDPSRFGVVELDSVHRIRRFVEKPKLSEAPSRLVNGGIYLIEPQTLRMIPSGRRVSLEREIFPILAKSGRLSGYSFSSYWFDIGNISDYKKANFGLLQQSNNKSILRAKGSRLGAGVMLRAPTLLGEDSRVETEASVGPYTVIGKNSQIKRNAKVTKSILFDGVTIGEGSIVTNAILADNVVLGKKVRIEPGSLVSPSVRIGDGVRVGRNAIVHPYKEIITNIRSGQHIM